MGNPENTPDEERYSRRTFLKKFALGAAALAVPGVLAGCEADNMEEYICRGEPDHSIKEISKNTKYGEILASSPNLAKVVDYLRSIKTEEADGYDILMNVLENGYEPTKGLEHTEQVIAEWEQKYPGLEASEKQYILTVAQSLYVEANQLTSWSLRDYTEEEIDSLFYVSRFHGASHDCRQLPKGVPLNGMLYESKQVELETAYKMLPLALKLVRENPDATVVDLIRWVKSNFIHNYNDWITGVEWNFDVYEDGVPQNLDRLFDERIGGCREPSMVLTGLLRALNIPAFLMETPENKHHGGVYLPTSNNIVHGDHMAFGATLYPSELLLTDLDEVSGEFGEDSMLSGHLEEKLTEKFGNNPNARKLSSKLFRDGNNMGFRQIDGDKLNPGVILDTMQQECPQYNIRLNKAGEIESDFVRIKTLKEFSEDGTDAWA